MRPQTLLEIIDAAHLSKYLEPQIFPERGGIMLVAPPGSLKSKLIDTALADYPDRLILSDMNSNTFALMRNDLVAGKYGTIAFDEIEKLYQRNQSTATNIEGILKALTAQGWSRNVAEDPRMAYLRTRSLVIGGMTPDFYARRFKLWVESGFARRFLWFYMRVDDPWKIVEAIHKWSLIEIDGIPRRVPSNRRIPFDVPDNESKKLQKQIREQPDMAIPYILIKKIYAVLRWKYAKQPERPMQIIDDCAKALSQNGDDLVL